MAHNRLLVTGHAMGGREHSGCNTCNYDCSWLFEHPSTLLWADKIIITPYMDNTIENEKFPFDDIPVAKSIKKVFDVARQFDLIEVKNPSKIITAKVGKKLSEEVDTDRSVLEKLFPKTVRIGDDKKVPGQIFIENEEYCHPHIWSIYASLVLAKKWGAQCLFSERVINYCRYKFGSSFVTNPNIGYPTNPFNTIFNSCLPEPALFPKYMFGNIRSSQCSTCKLEKQCSNKYLDKLERNISKYLELRDYDEVDQIKQVISKIIKRLESEKEYVNDENIVEEFKNEERIISKRVHSTFPKIKRWTNMTLIVSLPVTLVSALTGLPMVSLAGASIAGVSEAVNKYAEYLGSKYRWIGFINKSTVVRTQIEK